MTKFWNWFWSEERSPITQITLFIFAILMFRILFMILFCTC